MSLLGNFYKFGNFDRVNQAVEGFEGGEMGEINRKVRKHKIPAEKELFRVVSRVSR